MGKVYRWFADLKEAAFRGVTDSITTGNDTDVTTRKAVTEINNKFGGMNLKREGENIFVEYLDGADTVRKKIR